MIDRHVFEPCSFIVGKDRQRIFTDWCGFGATEDEEVAFCGRLADDPVHVATPPPESRERAQ
jgi:hypothetical protein